MLRKSCLACFANTSFARFSKYVFRRFTFGSQDSHGFANTSFARLRNSQFRKNSQKGFSFRKFPQGFCNGQFAVVRKFCHKIVQNNVSNIQAVTNIVCTY